MPEKIIVLLSSPNRNGNSALAVDWLLQGVDQGKYQTEKIFLYDLKVPYLTNDNFLPVDDADNDIRELADQIESARIIVISSPIWNFSLPSALKNVIDRLLFSGRVWSEKKKRTVSAWQGKTFYLVFTGGAPWYISWPNYLGIFQLIFTLRYYGARTKFVRYIGNCGNGQSRVIDNRSRLRRSLLWCGRRYFH